MSDPFDDVAVAVQSASALITISRDSGDPDYVITHLYLLDNTAPIPPALMAEILRRSADELDPPTSPRPDEEIATLGARAHGDRAPSVVPKPSTT
ncbi:hypothetical protein [Nocardia wallacei]|uniref:hypothetical protein n=1 Tax=Nocardia wallacei TaxID=480035 RepID=UPI0024567BBB|nr:hypothetical protein [Nocardia wallacei]